jgi:competence protein ComEC
LFISVKAKRSLIGTAICLAYLLGVLLFHLFGPQTREPWESSVGQKVELVGQIADDPTVSPNGWTEFRLHSAIGRVDVRTHYLAAQRGFRVRVEGKLQKDKYTQGPEFSFATTQIISRDQSWLESLRQKFIAGMHSALPEPLASFALGLLLGTRALIPKPLQEQLTLVGLAHVVAVSGYNLTIITESLRKPLGRWSRRLGLWLMLLLILVFVVLSGGSASIVRAAIVSTLSLLAGFYGRRIKPWFLICLAAAITVAYQPSYLWADLGWRLSFAAFFGILVVAPILERRLTNKPTWLSSLVSQTLSAQLLTAPIIATSFGTFSVIAPLANLLVMPLIPLAMLLAVIAGLAGMLVPALAGWLAWPTVMLLDLILQLVHQLAQVPWAQITL